jgi:hypothetical protein
MVNKNKLFSILFFLSLFGWLNLFIDQPIVPIAHAATINVANCTQTAVQNAITSAASGDVVVVPAGNCVWSGQISVTKAINLQGAGKASTIITGGIDYSPTIAEATKTFELSGFTFQGTGAKFSPNAPTGTNPITGLKVHDNRFTGSTVRALVFNGLEFGVIYNNTFDNNYISVSVISSGDVGWNYNHTFGSANYPYFEDNTFNATTNSTNGFVFETGQGGRIAFRHNTIIDPPSTCTNQFCELFDIHGDQGDRGSVSSEVYHNTISAGPANTIDRWIDHRGGQAIIANNIISRNIDFNFTEYTSWAGNSGNPNNCGPYPAPDQINNSYYFNNIAGGVSQTPTFSNGGNPGPCTNGGEAAFLVQNRDYWLPASGLASARPATCTANGNTYYGATDTDVIYKCTSTNTWTTFFTPYTYPHPLRGAATPPPPPPPSPTPTPTPTPTPSPPPGTINAVSCSLADVSTAIGSATYGNTVLVPAGNCIWNSALVITKAVKLQGAGLSSTVITSAVGSANFLIIYSPDTTSINNDYAFELSGFTFDMNNASGGMKILQGSNTIPMHNLKIHDMKFTNTVGDTSSDLPCLRTGDTNAAVRGQIYGVIYSNQFVNCASAVQSYGNDVNSWNNHTFSFGSADNLYLEDNTFSGNSAFNYGGLGGRYVARFNTYNFTAGVYQVVWDVHGNQPGSVYSTMGCEIYNNTVTLGRSTAVVDDRGGKCMVFRNALTGTAGDWQIREEYADSIDPTTNSQPQHVSDTYYFLNTQNGSNVNASETQDCCSAIAANVDYFNYSASFNGTSGVGSGTLATRPATCTTGVGYWATDQGSWNTLGADGLFYKCTSTNTWSQYYTPYIYPHPLRGGSTTPIAGDINSDHIVNSIDYSILNSHWFTNDSSSDLNHDGLVNAIDYSILNANWFQTW